MKLLYIDTRRPLPASFEILRRALERAGIHLVPPVADTLELERRLSEQDVVGWLHLVGANFESASTVLDRALRHPDSLAIVAGTPEQIVTAYLDECRHRKAEVFISLTDFDNPALQLSRQALLRFFKKWAANTLEILFPERQALQPTIQRGLEVLFLERPFGKATVGSGSGLTRRERDALDRFLEQEGFRNSTNIRNAFTVLLFWMGVYHFHLEPRMVAKLCMVSEARVVTSKFGRVLRVRRAELASELTLEEVMRLVLDYIANGDLPGLPRISPLIDALVDEQTEDSHRQGEVEPFLPAAVQNWISTRSVEENHSAGGLSWPDEGTANLLDHVFRPVIRRLIASSLPEGGGRNDATQKAMIAFMNAVAADVALLAAATRQGNVAAEPALLALARRCATRAANAELKKRSRWGRRALDINSMEL